MNGNTLRPHTVLYREWDRKRMALIGGRLTVGAIDRIHAAKLAAKMRPFAYIDLVIEGDISGWATQ